MIHGEVAGLKIDELLFVSQKVFGESYFSVAAKVSLYRWCHLFLNLGSMQR